MVLFRSPLACSVRFGIESFLNPRSLLYIGRYRGHFCSFEIRRLIVFFDSDVILLFCSTDASFGFALEGRDMNINSSEFAVSRVVYLRRTSVTVPFSIVVADGNDIVVDVIVVTGAVSVQSIVVIVLCVSARLIAGLVDVVTHVVRGQKVTVFFRS